MEAITPATKSDIDNKNDKKTESNKDVNDINTCIVNVIYDDLDRLVGINFEHMVVMPRKPLQLITLCSPFLPKLNRIAITSSHINMYTIFELQKFLMASGITDICLDYSPLPESNYYILLNEASNLKNLSLVGCHINDEVCSIIANKLIYGCPAERNLCLLNLTSNEITDIGAVCLGVMLRSNRCLRYLNLSANHVTDEGAARIFSALNEFSLHDTERYENRKRYVDYLKKRQEMLKRILSEYEDSIDGTIQSSRKVKTKKPLKSSGAKSDPSARSRLYSDDFSIRASIMAEEFIGPFEDPFSDNHVQKKENILYCEGNTTLCYLNLSYNNLSYFSLTQLQSVLMHQTLTKKPDQVGLLKVVLDGNNLPQHCQQLGTINDLLARAVNLRSPKEYGAKRKTPRVP